MTLGDRPERWDVIGSGARWHSSWIIAAREDRLRRHGEEFSRVVVETPGAVVILAVDEHQRALVFSQYRHPVAHRLIELPAGMLDVAGEDPLEAAKRELVEEAALQAQSWRKLLTLRPSPGVTDEVQHVFLAEDLSVADRGDFVLEHEEADLRPQWVPIEDLVEAILAGRISDGPLVAAVLTYHAAARRD